MLSPPISRYGAHMGNTSSTHKASSSTATDIGERQRIVLIPFRECDSDQLRRAVLGGPTSKEFEGIRESAISKSVEKGAYAELPEFGDDSNTNNKIVKSNRKELEDKINAKLLEQNIISKGWNKIARTNIVFLDSSSLSERLGVCVDETSMLYIVGHCGADAKTLSNISDNGKQISIDGIIEILNKGLRKDTAAHIKIFGCSSASFDRNETSFSTMLATAMHRAGWHNCRFRGYAGALKMYTNSASGKKLSAVHGLTAQAMKDDFFLKTKGDKIKIKSLK